MKTKITAFILLTVFAAPAFAQDTDHGDHGKHAASGPMADHMGAMDTMMDAMEGMESSGNADADFLLMMIPHHQSAIDMAEIELKHGEDAETRQLAQAIIDAQEKEIADMKAMLERLGVEAQE